MRTPGGRIAQDIEEIKRVEASKRGAAALIVFREWGAAVEAGTLGSGTRRIVGAEGERFGVTEADALAAFDSGTEDVRYANATKAPPVGSSTPDPLAALFAEAGFDALGNAPPMERVEAVLRALADGIRMAIPLRREAARTEAINRLEMANVRAPTRLVDAALGSAAKGARSSDEGQGSAVTFTDDEPASDVQDGAEVLDAVAEIFKRYVVLPEHAAPALALWTVHTYLCDVFAYSPRLALSSPTKRCGKSHTEKVLKATCRRPLKTENASVAAIFRIVERDHPTLLIDELDAFGEGKDELRGLINAGYEHGGTFLRCDGEGLEPKAFDVFSPVALAKIGTFPPTIIDRSIALKMSRKPRGTTLPRLPRPDRLTKSCTLLRSRIVRWTQDHRGALAEAAPVLPAALDDRASDLWEPLFAIADAAGGEWPKRARAAALALTGGRDDDDAPVRLLADVRTTFEERGVDRIKSALLVDALKAMPDRPWPTWGKSEKGLTENHLAAMLKTFEIKSGTIRFSDGPTAKGYYLSDFEEVFTKYLSTSPPSGDVTPSQCTGTPVLPANTAESETSQGKSCDACDSPENEPADPPAAPCDVVTDRRGGKGKGAPLDAYGWPDESAERAAIHAEGAPTLADLRGGRP